MNIIKVRNKFEISEFHQITHRLYKNEKKWIPHIKQDVESVFNPLTNSYHKDGEIERYILTKNNQTIGRVAVFYKRWLDMPRPPKAVKSDGSKIPINEYENSEEYKKYRKDWIQWWEKGDWNSPNIPKKYKVGLGFEDLSKISEK